MADDSYIKAFDRIIIGKIYKVVGRYGGCSSTKRCADCENYLAGLEVTSKYRNPSIGEKSVSGKSLTYPLGHCSFDPRDLQLKCPNWKKRLRGKQK